MSNQRQMTAKTIQIAEFTLQGERDVNWAAQRARLLGSLAGVAQRRRTAFGKAVREIACNAVTHAGIGTVTFGMFEHNGRTFVEAVIRDQGHGINDIGGIVKDEQPGKDVVGIGHGKQLVDSFRVDSDPKTGTVVRLAVALPDTAEPIDATTASDWAAALASENASAADTCQLLP